MSWPSQSSAHAGARHIQQLRTRVGSGLGPHRRPARCPCSLVCRSLLGVEAPGMAEMVHNCIQARAAVAAKLSSAWQSWVQRRACWCPARRMTGGHVNTMSHLVLSNAAERRHSQPPAAVQQYRSQVRFVRGPPLAAVVDADMLCHVALMRFSCYGLPHMPCRAMPCHAMPPPCPAMPCHAMPCPRHEAPWHAQPQNTTPCHAMPCHTTPCFGRPMPPHGPASSRPKARGSQSLLCHRITGLLL